MLQTGSEREKSEADNGGGRLTLLDEEGGGGSVLF